MTINYDHVKKYLAEKLALDEIDSSGEMCSFIDLKNGWGVKCYYDNEGIEPSYTVQKYLAEHGLAPQVGQRFNIIDYNGDEWGCYITEVAATIVPYGLCNSHAFNPNPDGYDYSDDWDYEYTDLFRDERDVYLDYFWRVTGFDYIDDHAGNFGHVDNKLVAIDFDTCENLYTKIKEKEACTIYAG